MERILILGSGGAGKSTLSREIGRRLGLEVIHLDAYFWRPGWVESQQEEWRREVVELVARDRWVMDGNFGSTFDLRVPRADTVIHLDMSRWLCLWSILKRIVRYYGRTRPDLAPGCPEKFDLEFIRWVWRFPVDSRQRIVEALERARQGSNPDLRVIRLTSRRAVADFLKSLP